MKFEFFESERIKKSFTLINIFEFCDPIIGIDWGKLENVSDKDHLFSSKAAFGSSEIKSHEYIDTVDDIGAEHTDLIDDDKRSLSEEFDFFFVEFNFFAFAV